MNVVRCDFCPTDSRSFIDGKYGMPFPTFIYRVQLTEVRSDHEIDGSQKQFDICPECYELMQTWIKDNKV